MAKEKFKCQFCGKMFPTKDAKQVLGVLTGNKYQVCSDCKKGSLVSEETR